MGNVVIVIALVIFAAVWSRFAADFFWNLICSFKIQTRFSLQGTWYWGLGLITMGLLLSFAVMAMIMPWLLGVLFRHPQEVSQDLIAIGILACLCLSWLISLNGYRGRVESHFLED